MLCSSCNNNFDNIDNLKFCPYCGVKLMDKTKDDTLEMPKITDEDIKNYNRAKMRLKIKSRLLNKRLLISFATIIIIMLTGYLTYDFFQGASVDTTKIRKDLIGKKLTLPKGTVINIDEDNLKTLNVNSRVTDKKSGKDRITAGIELNNGVLDVTGNINVTYSYQGNNQWKIDNQIALADNFKIKPASVMDETQFINQAKKYTINFDNTSEKLDSINVKSIKITSRKTDLSSSRDVVYVRVNIDNGTFAAEGDLVCSLIFADENWNLSGVERKSRDDFKLSLSSNFSVEKLISAINNNSFDVNITDSHFFNNKKFTMKDKFIKNISIKDKSYDKETGIIDAKVRREFKAGSLNAVIITDYKFDASYDSIKVKDVINTTLESVTAGDISKEEIISKITGYNMESNNVFLWWSNHHKITADEAKTLVINDSVSSSDMKNVKNVYGKITYDDGGSNKTSYIVMVFELIYNDSYGYQWSLNKMISDASPSYNDYSNNNSSKKNN